MKLFIGIIHARFSPERREAIVNLLCRLGARQQAVTIDILRSEDIYPLGEDYLNIECDDIKRGSWIGARNVWFRGSQVTTDATHVVLMNDDAMPCQNFVAMVKKAIEAHRDEIMCFYNHNPVVKFFPPGCYTTRDGMVSVACAMPVEKARAFLKFHDEKLNEVGQLNSEDGKVNVFAMWNELSVWHTVPALVDHQLPRESLLGNNEHGGRTAASPPYPDNDPRWEAVDFSNYLGDLGRHFRGNHWRLITDLADPADRRLKRAYDLHQVRPTILDETRSHVEKSVMEAQIQALQAKGVEVQSVPTEDKAQ